MELIDTIDENQDINACQQAAAQILSCFDQKASAADAVSYTHLDVYKRQGQQYFIEKFLKKEPA